MSIQNSSTAPIARRLEGKVAVITGGASGIGASTARLFVQQGAKVIIAGDVHDDLGFSLCQQLNVPDEEETISYIHCNITIDSDVKNLVDTAIAKYGKLDIMYNNAGTAGTGGTLEGRILETQDHEFKRLLDVNVFGSYLGAKHAARVMIPAKKGSIIFTASLSSISVGEVPHGYAASKHAVVGLAKNLCVELGQYGIRVNCISPFGVATRMMREATGMEKENIEQLIASAATLKGTILEAQDIAEAALYLGSDESKYVSGVNLPIDGGYSTHNSAFPMTMKSHFSSLGV